MRLDYDGPGFFSEEDRYTRGLAWYASHFDLASRRGRALVVDGSQGYLSSPFAAARVRATLARPESHRVLIVLRDPAELGLKQWDGK